MLHLELKIKQQSSFLRNIFAVVLPSRKTNLNSIFIISLHFETFSRMNVFSFKLFYSKKNKLFSKISNCFVWTCNTFLFFSFFHQICTRFLHRFPFFIFKVFLQCMTIIEFVLKIHFWRNKAHKKMSDNSVSSKSM